MSVKCKYNDCIIVLCIYVFGLAGAHYSGLCWRNIKAVPSPFVVVVFSVSEHLDGLHSVGLCETKLTAS